ncbi:lipid-binding SYLF domain-containing protein [Paraburkholderia sp. WC7.3g]|uniref:BPSL1445 family SYLF domain-containing lipoprotein n=1 Tax=Paraburkholderia sp. WC7.3g TaxID=2991070 RepID=UPI003D23F326
MQTRGILLKGIVAMALGCLVLSGCGTTSESSGGAAVNTSKRQAIDASVDDALAKLYAKVSGSKELVAKAQGVLMFPNVVQAGIGIGGEHGDGALRIGGSTVGYYSTSSGSIGAILGVQTKAVIYLFMTQDALNSFRNASGWSVSGDASVALVKVGANGTIDSSTVTAPVEVFILTDSGLMFNVSLAGSKITRLDI